METKRRLKFRASFYDPSRGKGWIVIREDGSWCGHLHQCFTTAEYCLEGKYKNPRRGRGGKIMRSIGWDRNGQPRAVGPIFG